MVNGVTLRGEISQQATTFFAKLYMSEDHGLDEELFGVIPKLVGPAANEILTMTATLTEVKQLGIVAHFVATAGFIRLYLCFLVAAAGHLWSLFLQLVLLIFSWSLSGSFICLTLAIGLLLWVSLLLLPSAVSWGFVLSGLSVAVLVLGLCSFLMVFIISQLLSLGFPAFLQLNFLDLQLDSQLAFAGLHVPFYVLFFFDGLCHIGFLVFVKARLPCFL
ncbi:unnamed protein product [Ilex paraguariensis]|uniref:Uncharacterized protein n=1 Tax=Ilex paraguariensis TaxID=185542 RepID=A0ABC8SQE3_9AQUA